METDTLNTQTTPVHAHTVYSGPHSGSAAAVPVMANADPVPAPEPPAAPKKENPEVVTVTLQTPLDVDGKERTEITLNFAKLTAKDHINIEEEIVEAQLTVIKNTALSDTYCLYIASRACGINIGDLERLKFRDANKILAATRNFMNVSE